MLLRTLSAAALSFLLGCSTTAILTPIEGPLAKQGVREIRAKVDGIAGFSGPLTFTMPDGESVKGKWIAVAGEGRRKGAATAHGSRGSVFDVEFESDISGRGIGKATDNRGNVYRVIVGA